MRVFIDTVRHSSVAIRYALAICCLGLQACRASLPGSHGAAWPYLKLHAKVAYQNDQGNRQSVRIALRIKRDHCIWFSITTPWGWEVVRGMATPEKVMLVNYNQQVYHTCSYARLRQQWQMACSYDLLQALLLGELPKEESGAWALQYQEDRSIQRLVQLTATDTTNGHQWRGTYQRFKPSGKSSFFQESCLQLLHRIQPGDARPIHTIRFSRIKVRGSRKPLAFPFIIPTHYVPQ